MYSSKARHYQDANLNRLPMYNIYNTWGKYCNRKQFSFVVSAIETQRGHANAAWVNQEENEPQKKQFSWVLKDEQFSSRKGERVYSKQSRLYIQRFRNLQYCGIFRGLNQFPASEYGLKEARVRKLKDAARAEAGKLLGPYYNDSFRMLLPETLLTALIIN